MAGVFSGIAIAYAKLSVMKIDPLLLTSSRNTVAFIIITSLFLIQRKTSQKTQFSHTNIKKMIVLGIVGGSIPFILFFIGLKQIGALEANIIQKSLFIWTALLGFVFFRSSIKIHKLYPLIWIFLVVGTYLLSGIKLSLSYGSLLVLTATLFWSIESLLVHWWKGMDSSLMTIGRMGFGLIILWSIIIVTGKISIVYLLSFEQVQTIIIGGIILSGYVFCFYRALRYSPAHVVASLLTISTVIGWLVSFVFSPASISPKEIVSYASLFVGISMIIVINIRLHRVKPHEYT
jgi:drug/metabolite transporter (DMT)-like permease